MVNVITWNATNDGTNICETVDLCQQHSDDTNSLPDELPRPVSVHHGLHAGTCEACEFARCACGTATGVACTWTGRSEELVTVEWMPEHLRESHAAANNRGVWPHNGALRLSVSPECGESLINANPSWCERL